MNTQEKAHTPGPWKWNEKQDSIFSDNPEWKYSYIAKTNARLIAAAPELLEALQLDMAFHGRPFARDSIEEFRLLGYNGPAASGEMRAFLWEKKRAVISKAEKGAQ
jgi:hypothetical protein